jgi:FMN phosphatase YigB (HAD superfamily)
LLLANRAPADLSGTCQAAAPRARIFFDCDDTLLTWNWRLRPHSRETLARLRELGFHVYLWSGLGERWDVVRHFRLDGLVRDCFAKPLYRHRERLAELGIGAPPDYTIDDAPQIVDVFGGWLVPASTDLLADDRCLLDALADIERRFPV